MERTSMAALISGIFGAVIVLVGLIVGTGFAQAEGTRQLTSCVENGGTYLIQSGNPTCIMPGTTLPEQ